MTAKTVILVFVDGVGLGDTDPQANPFMNASMPVVQGLLNVPHLVAEAAGTIAPQAALLGLDALLGVDGLPQSGTGQATILSGHNAAALLGQHYGPYPNYKLRKLLARDSIFKTLLSAGQAVAYANAYPARFLDRVARGKGRLSANTRAAFMAGLKLRSGHDLRRGRAIPALLDNRHWPETDFELPPLSPRQAGAQLAHLARDHTLTFFEFWYCDRLGHKQERQPSLEIIGKLDDFLAGILAAIDPARTLLMVASDHGNFEDWTTDKHTLNPALAFLSGADSSALVPRLHSLADIKPALLAYIFGNLAKPVVTTYSLKPDHSPADCPTGKPVVTTYSLKPDHSPADCPTGKPRPPNQPADYSQGNQLVVKYIMLSK